MTNNAEKLMNDAYIALQNFYNQHFTALEQQSLKVTIGYLYVSKWRNNQELVWAEKLLNTSKIRQGTSAETVCGELIPVVKGWLNELLIASAPQSFKTGYKAQLLTNTLPQYLAIYYVASLNYDILNYRFSTTKDSSGKIKITKVNFEVS